MKKLLFITFILFSILLDAKLFQLDNVIFVSKFDSEFNTIKKALDYFAFKNDTIASIVIFGSLDCETIKIPEKIKIVNIKGSLAYNIGANDLKKTLFLLDTPEKILLFDHLDNFSIYGTKNFTLFASMCYINDLISDTPEKVFIEIQNSEISGNFLVKNLDENSILFGMNLLNTKKFIYPSNIITAYTLLPNINYLSTSKYSLFYNNYNESTRGFFFVDRIKRDSTRIYGGTIETKKIIVGNGPQITKFFKKGSYAGIIFDDKDTFYFIKDTNQIIKNK